ncbi:MAG: hypothetical protein GC160_09350 [Acidobacteria bacterium]|nr:hypothetical protein [Acidobacteriota bacterium]
MAFQAFSTAVYRLAGRAIARALGSFDFVETVFLRHTAATGEVSLGRSDIDFTLVFSRPLTQEPEGLLKLLRCRQALKAAFPLLGECETGTREELLRSYGADPYRASVERRTALTVYGPRLEIPAIPIRTEDALVWLVIWMAHYVPVAMRQRSRRNMRKFALEMWNAARTATGDVAEPYASRSRAEAAWRNSAGAAFPLRSDDSVERLFQVCQEIAVEAHGRLCDPLETEDMPALHAGADREWALVPPGREIPPRREGLGRAFSGSPEALDLFVRHVNPRMYQQLPDSVKRLGIRPPGRAEWLAFSRRFACDPRLLRRPGFIATPASSYYAFELIRPGREAARSLRAGALPSWNPRREEDLRATPPTLRSYYTNLLPGLYEEISAAWDDLDACAGPA